MGKRQRRSLGRFGTHRSERVDSRKELADSGWGVERCESLLYTTTPASRRPLAQLMKSLERVRHLDVIGVIRNTGQREDFWVES